jgi:aspartokinase-like uncharacterized kinase
MLRIVKLGGSLLDCHDLAARLRRWLAIEPHISTVLIVGGGRGADLVRARSLELSDTEAHWLAIRAMENNARVVAAMLPEAIWLERIHAVRTTAAPLALLSPLSFMRNDDPCHPAGPLPANWSVTSDSIAARVADMAQAAELILLKSALPPEGATLEQLAATGYVDAHFPQASRNLPRVRYVNLRSLSVGVG